MHTIEGRIFKSDSSLTNHVRWRIKHGLNRSIEDFYLQFFGTVKKCEFCDNPSAFLSLFRGYKQHCGSESCSIASKEKRIKQSLQKDGNEDFLDHIRSNFDYYVDQFCNGTSYVDVIYNNRRYPKSKIRGFFARMTPTKDLDTMKNLMTYQNTCPSCKILYQRSLFDAKYGIRNTCLSKRCISFYKNCKTLTYIEKKELESKERDIKTSNLPRRVETIEYAGDRFDICFSKSLKVDRDFLCKDLLKKHGLSYDTLILSAFDSTCFGCGTRCTNIRKIERHVFSKTKINFFCSHACYYVAKKRGDYKISMSARQQLSDKMKRKIADGTFTPKVTNSRCRSRIYIENIPFRSSWDAAFFLMNQHMLYENIRIPYEIEGVKRTYIVDFYDKETNTAYEIKPKSMMSDDIVISKHKAAEEYSRQHGMSFVIIDDDWFIKNYENVIRLKGQMNIDEIFWKRMEQFNGNRIANQRSKNQKYQEHRNP